MLGGWFNDLGRGPCYTPWNTNLALLQLWLSSLSICWIEVELHLVCLTFASLSDVFQLRSAQAWILSYVFVLSRLELACMHAVYTEYR